MPDMVCKGLGHQTCQGGSLPLNPFGEALRANGFKWTEGLCNADSDEDGLTNGEELGDPCCRWEPFGVESNYTSQFVPSHPGVASDKVSGYFRPACNETEPAERAMPLDQFNPDEKERVMELFVANYTIPTQVTTYVDFAWNFEDETADIFHIVWAEAIVRTPKHLHHYVVRGCAERWPPEQVGRPVPASSAGMLACQAPVGGWAPGKRIISTPSFAGVPVGKAVGIVAFLVSVHYDNPGLNAGVVSNDGMLIHYTPTLRRESIGDLSVMRLSANPLIALPPHKRRYFITRTCRLHVRDMASSQPRAANLFAVSYHAHLLGREMYLELRKLDGTMIDVGSDRLWHFDDQYTRNVLSKNLSVETGDVLQGTCVYDTSERTEDTIIFKETTDEMCWAGAKIWPATVAATCEGQLWFGELGEDEHGLGLAHRHPARDAPQVWDGTSPTGGGLVTKDGHRQCADKGDATICNLVQKMKQSAGNLGGSSPEDIHWLCDATLGIFPTELPLAAQKLTIIEVCCTKACELLCPENGACLAQTSAAQPELSKAPMTSADAAPPLRLLGLGLLMLGLAWGRARAE